MERLPNSLAAYSARILTNAKLKCPRHNVAAEIEIIMIASAVSPKIVPSRFCGRLAVDSVTKSFQSI